MSALTRVRPVVSRLGLDGASVPALEGLGGGQGPGLFPHHSGASDRRSHTGPGVMTGGERDLVLKFSSLLLHDVSVLNTGDEGMARPLAGTRYDPS